VKKEKRRSAMCETPPCNCTLACQTTDATD
jgi:hypothetical protein